ncbi:hypothetical protein NGTWS0302_11580 [Mycolicibacterium cyprinidarum]|uniref:DUF2613 domain-containing protein n=1 Tax=Mycolicibacterium cyprinidarum TaxID=2860311 RepID=A0ABQ4V9L2_9MYCO|nr:hypothetical protein NGTWS1803_11550 [Mycolicibacterium sp. NGTWS1803]GJF15270.1 hypothetical protein NGTWS1702_18370 [Mycolicibacterium sp. NGTWSNA01]GJF16388.1 hypothetical protein NGTWS0302_11580 [Mycolicibacterium sp. NGTWS0302]
MNTVTRILVLPLISAGILGGALSFAGTAAAEVTHRHNTNGSHAIVATPDTKANAGNNGMTNWHQRRADRRAQMGW